MCLLVFYRGSMNIKKGKTEAKKTLPEYCIWDFNGTLLDDVETGIQSVNVLLEARGLPCLQNREEYQKVFCFPIQRYYEKLGFDFEKEPYEKIAPLWVEQYLNRVEKATLFCDVKQTLIIFQEKGIKQIILSATELTMLRGQLQKLGIEDFFEEILGLDNIHAVSKIELAREWRKKHPCAKAIFLGDTDHDYETARSIGAECFLVTRGHQSKEALSKLDAPMYDSLAQFGEAYFKERMA